MKKDKIDPKIKKTADEMASKIFEYLEVAVSDEDKRDELFLELATSFLTATCDFDMSPRDICEDIHKKCKDMQALAIFGALKFKSGDISRVVSDSRDFKKE